MRIGVFYPLINNIGGGEYLTIVLMDSLKEKGHQVFLMSNRELDQTRTKYFFGKSVSPDGNVSPLFDLSTRGSRTRPFDLYAYAMHLYILKLKCDIVIDPFSDFIFPWSDITIVQIMPRDILRGREWHPTRPSFLLQAPLFSLSAKKEKTLFVVSKYLAGFLNEKGFKCSVLYPPVDTHYFKQSTKNLHEPRENLVVSGLRFSSDKLLEKVVEIARQVHKDISFVIAGHCESAASFALLQSLKALIEKYGLERRVKLLPNISRERIKMLFHNSKVFLHCCENEAFGITIVEAMASGCTPVVPDLGGLKEIVPDCLRYVNMEDAATKVEQAVRDWSVETSVQTSKIADGFSEEQFSRNFLTLLDSHLEKAHRT